MKIKNFLSKVFLTSVPTLLVPMTASSCNTNQSTHSNYYKFQNYTTADGLNTISIDNAICSKDGNTIYVLEASGYFGVGTLQSDNSYKFTNYQIASLSSALKPEFGYMDIDLDTNTVFIATFNMGLFVGNLNKDNQFVFTNYKLKSPLYNEINKLYYDKETNKLYCACAAGIAIATKNSTSYSFQYIDKTTFGVKNVKAITAVYVTNNANEMYIATGSGLFIGTLNGASYKFTAYLNIKGLTDVYATSDKQKIIVISENLADSLYIGILSGSSYIFRGYPATLSPIGTDIFALDKGNNFFISTADGVTFATLNKNKDYTFINYPFGAFTHSVYATLDASTVVAATTSGVYVGKK